MSAIVLWPAGFGPDGLGSAPYWTERAEPGTNAVRPNERMPLIVLILAALLASGSVAVVRAESSSSAGQKSAVEDNASTAAIPQGRPDGDATWDLPVSLDRIREGLARSPSRPLLQNVSRKPDFRQEIQMQRQLYELLSKLDLKASPKPPGGIYAYEQQQRLWNSVDHPLMQPYAAFGGGQMITLAIEGLATKYLGGRALKAITALERARAQAAARADVSQAIGEYCATLPGGGVDVWLCEAPDVR